LRNISLKSVAENVPKEKSGLPLHLTLEPNTYQITSQQIITMHSENLTLWNEKITTK